MTDPALKLTSLSCVQLLSYMLGHAWRICTVGLVLALLLSSALAHSHHHHSSHGGSHRSLLSDTDLAAEKARPLGKAALAALEAMGSNALNRVAKAHKMTATQLKRLLERGEQYDTQGACMQQPHRATWP